jgi:L-amino acid N-acyltransferase YncA
MLHAMPDITCVPLSANRLDDYLAFFDTKAFTDNPRWAGCYCYYPVHDPERTEWAQRTAAENRDDVTACIHAGTTAVFLAYRDTEVVGWCHAGPWSMYPMLRDDPEPDAAKLGVVFCFVVAPTARGKGVATALLAAACEGLRAQGMTEVRAGQASEECRRSCRQSPGSAADVPCRGVPRRPRDRRGRRVRAQGACLTTRNLAGGGRARADRMLGGKLTA